MKTKYVLCVSYFKAYFFSPFVVPMVPFLSHLGEVDFRMRSKGCLSASEEGLRGQAAMMGFAHLCLTLLGLSNPADIAEVKAHEEIMS